MQTKQMQESEKGYSLIEMMIVLGISAFLACVMFAAMRVGDVQVQDSDLRMTIQDSAREGVYKMVQELRETSPTRVVLAANCSSVTFSIPDPAAPVSGAFDVQWLGNQITYQRNANGQITRTLNGVTTVMANDVSSVMFTTDTTPPFACTTAAPINTISVVMNVQRTLKNRRVVPAVPLQIAGQAKTRNA